MTTDLHLHHTRPPATAPPPLAAASGRALRMVGGFLLIVASLAGALLWLVPSASAEHSETTIHPAVDRLVLQLGASGDVDIRVHDAEEIIVAQEVRSSITDVQVSQTVTDGELRLQTDRCQGWFALPWNRCSASFVVTVPASTVVEGTANGEITVTGLSGSADLQTGNGRIAVTDTSGRLDLRTANGTIEIVGASGDVAVTTNNGEISLTDVRGAVEASTDNGEIEVDGAGDRLVVGTDNGEIHVRGTTGDVVELMSSNGEILFAPDTTPRSAVLDTDNGDIEVLLPPDSPPVAVDGDTADGSPDIGVATDPRADHRLEARTGNGNISVAYAATSAGR